MADVEGVSMDRGEGKLQVAVQGRGIINDDGDAFFMYVVTRCAQVLAEVFLAPHLALKGV
jgi:hypothetical protein